MKNKETFNIDGDDGVYIGTNSMIYYEEKLKTLVCVVGGEEIILDTTQIQLLKLLIEKYF